ncbi:MAG TPA: HAMP domain-containing sensor histidine kinase [Cyclobacteriaceae bacterium]|nr:HAMP domain-containing sensor histidine kinase [Cyclobacteriaceae bacterium]
MKRINLLVVVATVAYAFLDKYLGIIVAPYVYVGFLLFAAINGLLIRYGYVEVAKVFGLLLFNIMIFIIATSEPFSTGMYLQYVTAGSVALALYGYEQWKGALFFVLLSLILNVIVFTSEVSFIPWREVDTQQANVFFILNTLIAAVVSVYAFMFYSKTNYESELALKANEKLIKAQNEELLKTNTELDRFVYSASHDLRSPLSTLTGLINLSKLETDDAEKSKYLDLMNERIRAMDTFISEIIDYSRNSRVAVKKESVNAKILLESIADDLRYHAGKGRIAIHWEIPEDLAIITDVSRLKIVFSNLISNVIKYHDPDKEISWIKLKAEAVSQQVLFTVEDNGIGINKELKGNIFDMFYRAHEHSTGSGLGLYIVKETLAKLNGMIKVESSEGEGSRFLVTLPSAL